MTQTPGNWPYPGSRWWKFDFHTHTPESADTLSWQRAIGTADEVTPKGWLLHYMAAEIDCVAITDHNSGAWVDQLKVTYAQMKVQNVEGFRELHLFPGVEISVQGGFHLLAILDPSATTSDIDSLLGAVDYAGTKGDSDGETRKGPAEVVEAVLRVGVAVPAHADGPKGLLEVEPGTHRCRRNTPSVLQVMEAQGILAMEWCNPAAPTPAVFNERRLRWARVLGSDSHSFQGAKVPGSHFTWIKTASPSIEGLRLALLDGNGVSVRRSDEGHFDPWKTPEHFISRIEVCDARFMGNGKPEALSLTPFYNALIGGRGTGKSTIVHSLRLAYRRDDEVRRLSADAEPRRQFERFRIAAKGRDGEGALRDNTEIRVELMRDGVAHRLRWRTDGQGLVVEVKAGDGSWQASPSQTINAERFPIRLFSQGQIAALAGDNRQALLEVIDEATAAAPLHRAFDENKRTYMAQRARLRELDGKLAMRSELERKLADLGRKLETFTQSHHADVLKAHQRAQRQRREVDALLQQWADMPARIEALAQDLVFEDWPAATFELPDDADVLAWRGAADVSLRSVRQALAAAARQLAEGVKAAQSDGKFVQWQSEIGTAQSAYEVLKATLAAQGVEDPQAFGRLVQERQQLESQSKALDQMQRDRKQLDADIEGQWERVLEARRAITNARSDFLCDKLQDNAFVRMEIEPFGSDSPVIERSLREVLEVLDDRFEADVESISFRADLLGSDLQTQIDAQLHERIGALNAAKDRMVSLDPTLGGHFRNYLQRKLERPEFADHLRCWFPEDDLRIEYSRKADGRDFVSIDQGASPGQRAAALLAFLLAFGDEPLVLDQPEDDLDNHLIYELIVRQIRQNKLRRQLIVVTHNSNIVVNGDAEMVHAFEFGVGQCHVSQKGALQERAVRKEVCQVMEGGRDAFEQRWARLGREV